MIEYNEEEVRRYHLIVCEYDTWDNPYVFLNLTALEVVIQLGIIDSVKLCNFDLLSGNLEEFKQIITRLENNSDIKYTCIATDLIGIASQEFPEITQDLMYRLFSYMINYDLF